MTKAVLLMDAIGWVDEDGHTHYADKSDGEVELPSKEFDRLKKLGAVAAPGKSAAPLPGWPKTDEALDVLAAENDITWADEDKTVADKQQRLASAGVEPAAPGSPTGSAAEPNETTEEQSETPTFPVTHKELDALAKKSKVSWPEGTRTVAEKHAALASAGVEAPTE